MANVKISALPIATAAAGTDVVPLVQGGTTKRLSMTALLSSPTLFGAGMNTFLATPSSANLRAALTDETGTGSAVFAVSPTLASPTLTTPTVTAPTVSSGNLTFSGTAQRITGDFSNATHANRLSFQTSTTNGATSPFLLPNGTGNTAQWVIASASDPTNSSYLGVGIITAASARITSDIIGTGTYLPMTFYTGGSERVRIDTSGNVGIGTASPGTKLEIAGGVSAQQTAGRYFGFGTAGFSFDGTTVNDYGLTYTQPSGSEFNTVLAGFSNIKFATNQLERMRIDSSGNVGIGTASPGVRLQVEQNQAAYTYVDLVNTTNGGGAIFRQIVRNIANTGTTSVDFAKLIGSGLAINNNDTNAANFTSFGVGGSERMRIDSSGNVGIGTASPGAKLDVQSAAPQFRVTDPSTASFGQFVSYDLGGGTRPTAIRVSNDGSGGTTDVMSFLSSGNVGIGTASPFSSSLTNTRAGNVRYVWGDTSQAADKRYWDALASGGILYFRTISDNDSNSTSFMTVERGTGVASNWIVSAVTLNTAGTERMRIDSSGAVGIGDVSPGQRLAVLGDATAGASQVLVRRFSNDASGPTLNLSKSRGTSGSAVTAVQNNDAIGSVSWTAADGAAFFSVAAITARIDGTPAANDLPTAITFTTTPAGSTTGQERMRIDKAGNVVVNTAALATTATDGFLYVPTCAGTPTGVPTTYTGRAPIVVNTTNNKLYFYSGGAWRDAGP